MRAAIISVLVLISFWKCESWKNPLAAARDAAYYHVSQPHDFFQEWASGRNYFAGIPIYDPQNEAYVREFAHLGFNPPPRDATPPDMNPIDAHPPPSLLIFLPLARVRYVTALLSPITWPHGFLILLLPLVLLARRLEWRQDASLVFACCLVVLLSRPTWWLFRFQSANTPFQHWVPYGGLWLVTTVAFHCYALLGIFALLVFSVSSRSS